MKYIVLLALLGFAAAQQFQTSPQYNKNTRDADVTIVKQYFDELANGAVNWGYQASDGSERQEQISFKSGGPDKEPIVIQEGFYTYNDADSKLVKVTYRADENGFVILNDNRIVKA